MLRGGAGHRSPQASYFVEEGARPGVHEVLTLDWLSRRPDFHEYAARHHTTAAQLTELATKARPRLLILYHASLSLRPAVDTERSAPATLLEEMSGYAGRVVVGRDLDVY